MAAGSARVFEYHAVLQNPAYRPPGKFGTSAFDTIADSQADANTQSMALNAINSFNQLSHYHLGNLLFRLGLWRSAATQLRKVASRIHDDASSLASAQLFVRLAICHLKLGSNDKAAEAYRSFRKVLGNTSFRYSHDKKWLSLYSECIRQTIEPGEPVTSDATHLLWDAVSDRVKRLFPVEHLSEHFSIAMQHVSR